MWMRSCCAILRASSAARALTRCTILVGRSVKARTESALTGGQRDPVHADGLPAAIWELDGFEESAVASTLGLGALTNVATLDELVVGRGEAWEGVASLY